MKTVYFVRHGETENNASKRFNLPDTPLSERGKKQAEDIAGRCTKLPIDLIVASPFKRAQQTAEIVSDRIGVKTGSSELFVEAIYTSRFFGKRVDDPEVQTIIDMYFKSFSDPQYRFEDGETFGDLKKRALAGLGYLEEKDAKNILVVSHAFFIWIIAAAAIFGKELTADECHGIIKGLELAENAGLTVLTHGGPPRKSIGEPVAPWQLKVWNDHAHLG